MYEFYSSGDLNKGKNGEGVTHISSSPTYPDIKDRLSCFNFVLFETGDRLSETTGVSHIRFNCRTPVDEET